MKYAVSYVENMPINGFDEIIIDIEKQTESYQLYEFLRAKLPQQIVVCINDIADFIRNEKWHELNTLYKKIDSFSVCIKTRCRFELLSSEIISIIEKLEVPFFIGYLVTDFDQLHYILKTGAQQVYITENMCFKLDKVKKVCKQYGDDIKVRCFANVAQSSIANTNSLKKFFIRPEDVSRYEQYIDVIEFWGTENKQNILYRIYNKGFWGGNLNEIILGLDTSIDSRCILPYFAQARATCGRTCLEGGPCAICDSIAALGEKLKDKNMQINNEYL